MDAQTLVISTTDKAIDLNRMVDRRLPAGGVALTAASHVAHEADQLAERAGAAVRSHSFAGHEGRNPMLHVRLGSRHRPGPQGPQRADRAGQWCRRGVAWTMCMRALLVASGLIAGAAQAQGGAGPHPVVPPAEQALRDGERMRILHDELAKEQDRLAEAARRRAERVAARDAQGEKDAEAAQQRSTANIAALRREIDLAGRSAQGAGPAVAAAAGTPGRRPVSRASTESPRPAWWDVYGKAPRRGDAAAQQVSATSEPATAAGERAW